MFQGSLCTVLRNLHQRLVIVVEVDLVSSLGCSSALRLFGEMLDLNFYVCALKHTSRLVMCIEKIDVDC